MESFVIQTENSEQAKALKAFLKAFNIPFQKTPALPQHVVSGIKQGQKDINSGLTVSLEEFKKKLSSQR